MDRACKHQPLMVIVRTPCSFSKSSFTKLQSVLMPSARSTKSKCASTKDDTLRSLNLEIGLQFPDTRNESKCGAQIFFMLLEALPSSTSSFKLRAFILSLDSRPHLHTLRDSKRGLPLKILSRTSSLNVTLTIDKTLRRGQLIVSSHKKVHHQSSRLTSELRQYKDGGSLHKGGM